LEDVILEEPVLGIGGFLALEHQACVTGLFDIGDMGLLLHFPKNGIGYEPEQGLVGTPQQILALHLALRRFPDIFMGSAILRIPKDHESVQLKGIFMEKGGTS
jgi:hypothetical protein